MSYSIHELQIGESRELRKLLDDTAVAMFAEVTTDKNPIHLDDEAGKNSIFGAKIAHGMLSASLFSSIFGMVYPGKGTLYLGQSAKFTKPIFVGEEVRAVVTCKELRVEKNIAIFETIVYNSKGEVAVVGEATLMPPKK